MILRCLLGHRFICVVKTWTTWGYSHRRHRFVWRKHRKQVLVCSRCGKESAGAR